MLFPLLRQWDRFVWSKLLSKRHLLSWMMLWQLICAEKLSLFRHSVMEIRLQICRKGRCYCFYTMLPLVILLTIHSSTACNVFWIVSVPWVHNTEYNPQHRSCWIIEHPSANFYVTTIATCVGCAAYCLYASNFVL